MCAHAYTGMYMMHVFVAEFMISVVYSVSLFCGFGVLAPNCVRHNYNLVPACPV